ncbi:MAG: hypothetical protein HY812_13920 [Planctomycetes bacterium]|nr:hypothetical protein [Planctomycetota bacterium]
MRAFLAAGVLTSLVLSACGPAPPNPALAVFQSALAQAQSGQEATFIAERRYTDYAGSDAGTHTERFVQGQGGVFRVDLLTLDGLAREQLPTQEAVDEFDRKSARFAAGFGTYIARSRDFRVRDLDLFSANYTFVLFDAPVPVAGRPAQVAEVKPKSFDRPWYMVWVDLETLVTLKYLEFLPSGVLAAEMETLAIEYDPDLSQETFQPAAHTEQMEVDPAQLAALVSFRVFAPSYTPSGFVRSSCRTSRKADQDVVMFSYSDGLQELFVAQYQELPGSAAAASGTEPIRVGMARYGAAHDAELSLLGTQLHFTGKVDAQELMLVVECLDLLP